ncbi:hypothetical protein K2173_008916 [Erythroxylum novogranatense]|uniref:RCC1-like domain-containing protein n=1 Tax=Erythroxylum novogranatense TaxID=1862640 RepID=A0AAV8S4L4_9ROSI|nr:hypothetical protein K2173_008916 [Erythroxylum novogranatense]
MEECKETAVYMCGYLPGVSQEKSPILSPVPVPLHDSESWNEVCGGGCGFAMAISGSGKLVTWGSTDDESQSYSTCGKHGEIPEPLPLPCEDSVVKASAGWAHCVSVLETGEVYTWGWKECVPSSKSIGVRDSAVGGSYQKDDTKKQSVSLAEANPKTHGSGITGEKVPHSDNKNAGEEILKRRKVTGVFTSTPSMVALGPGVRITTVAAGGRHTLALSDVGQVWGWGYGGEGQLGLGSRIKMVSSPHLIPCIESSASERDRSAVVNQGSADLSSQASKLPGSCVKQIACGGRHSAVVTDAGVLLTFGWGLYGQCGQGSVTDQLRPTSVNSLSGIQVEGIAAGLWHTVCSTISGSVYAFGGNQFGQLGTGSDQAETRPKLLDSPSLESKRVKAVSCGARHSFILTENGEVFSWGWNKYGQLGLGDTMDRNMPSQVGLLEGCQPKNVACGWWHTLLLGETPP